MIIELTEIEYQYLKCADFINNHDIKKLLSNILKDGHVYKLDIEEESLVDLYEILEDRLMFAGFDDNYKVTNEGAIIENLIDKIGKVE